ncbi:hypothetical protein MVEN_00335700 [Mycena venus]|uniref:Uncharacterized protein n=1 Tax=Mycena venus TaxID=2733690 RepID=A0A8H7D9M8_9AGAR|nr:hypothetical protein MVEN_00335700 [Mycena venus]
MHSSWTLHSFLLFAACAVAAPMSSRATSPLKCSNLTASEIVPATISGTQVALSEINAFSGIADAHPIFSAQFALLDAKPIAEQLESIALFPTSPLSNPPVSTAVDDLNKALASAQSLIANITVAPPLEPATPFETATFANNTIALQRATKNINNAIVAAQNSGCTSA